MPITYIPIIVIHLYLWSSAFGSIDLPFFNISLSSAVLISFILILPFFRPQKKDLISFVFLILIALIDLFKRLVFNDFMDLGYSFNIVEMALFIVVASFVSKYLIDKVYQICISFGIAAVFSEIFVMLFPEYRETFFSFGNFGVYSEYLFFRPTGLVGDPNYFALPIALMVVAFGCLRKYLLMFFGFLTLLYVGSRSGIIAASIPLVIMLNARYSKNIYKLFIVNVSFAKFFALSTIIISEMRSYAGFDFSNQERLFAAIQFFEHFATFSFLHSAYGEKIVLGLDGSPMVIHNTFLQTLITSLFLGTFLLYKLIRGFVVGVSFYLLLCLFIKMSLLDMSSFSAAFFIFFILVSEASGKMRVRDHFTTPSS